METDEEELSAGHFLMEFNATVMNYCLQGWPEPYIYMYMYIYIYLCVYVYIRCIRYFWQGNHQNYGHLRCIYTILANPNYLQCSYELEWILGSSGSNKLEFILGSSVSDKGISTPCKIWPGALQRLCVFLYWCLDCFAKSGKDVLGSDSEELCAEGVYDTCAKVGWTHGQRWVGHTHGQRCVWHMD
jgi:hypothetical protein